MDGKEEEIRKDFIWGAGPGALEEITKGEYNTDPDNIKADTLQVMFKEYYMPKRNTYHSRGDFFWAKQEKEETPKDHWNKLIKIEKNCEFEGIKPEEILISKFITSITEKKLRERLMREKKLDLKLTTEMIRQDTYDKRNKKSTIPEKMAKDTEIKEEPIQKIDKYRRTETRKKNI